MSNLKYYAAKVTHDNGQMFVKTTGSTEAAGKEAIMAFEKCPPSAIELIEIDFIFFSWKGEDLWKMYHGHQLIQDVKKGDYFKLKETGQEVWVRGSYNSMKEVKAYECHSFNDINKYKSIKKDRLVFTNFEF